MKATQGVLDTCIVTYLVGVLNEEGSMKTVVVGWYGSTLDGGQSEGRWNKWRPSVAVCRHDDLVVDRLELLAQPAHVERAQIIAADLAQVAPATEVRIHEVVVQDPWDIEEVFAAMHGFARSHPFDTEREDVLVHITTGSHVMQIVAFLLTESRHFPGRLLQTSPPKGRRRSEPGSWQIIDLDLSRYDALARRFAAEQLEGVSFLKDGIETRNETFNAMMDRLERVVLRSREPILLTGPSGAGKSQLARRIFALAKRRGRLHGNLVEVNCATLRGDGAMSALFGHVSGAFTGATGARDGLLRTARGGMLFLDEIGELGLDEQAMLLRAIEDKCFLPVGADHEVESAFQLVAGTNRDLGAAVAERRFREDLLARIDLWTFRLPALRERKEDIAPNLDVELTRATGRLGQRVTMNRAARERFLDFAMGSGGLWWGNFRDLSAAVLRMATLAPGSRIDADTVEEEIERLARAWRRPTGAGDVEGTLLPLLGAPGLAELDRFDQAQLADVVRVCRNASSLSDAGRQLFAVSRTQRKRINDADRLRKYLARFDLAFDALH